MNMRTSEQISSFKTLESSYDIGACIPLQIERGSPADDSIIAVSYYDGPSLIAKRTSPPFYCAWTTATRGSHTVRAVAIDEDGNETSIQTELKVNDPTKPVDLVNDVDRYNFTFDTLGVNARDCMPLGNGDVSLNVWTYPNGDVGLLIGKLDAYSQTGDGEGPNSCFSLRKIGQLRMQMDPPIFREAAEAGTYKQTLVLSEAAIYIGDGENQLKVWVDRNRSVIHTDLSTKQKVVTTVKNDSWRTEAVKGEHAADIVFSDQPDQLIWCYHDPRTDTAYRGESEGMVIQQNLPGAEYLPRYTTSTFGALVEGNGLTSVDDKTLRSHAVTECHTEINVHRYSEAGKATPKNWLPRIKAQTEKNRSASSNAWKEHLDWWQGFWDRSQLTIEGPEDGWRITSFYLHQRFIYACQTGVLQETWRIPFNGGIFNVDFQDVELTWAYHPKGVGVYPKDPSLRMTADFRFWGASDRSQNTRHTYNPMLLTGDYDLASAWYQWPAIIAQAWKQTAKQHTDLDDSFITSGITSWSQAQKEQNFVRRGDAWRERIVPEAIGLERGAAYRYTTNAADEFLPAMINYYELTRDEFFLENSLVPYAEGLFRFYEQFFPRDDDDKIVLWPCIQCEVYVRFYDDGYVPINPIAGVSLMRSQLPRLIALAERPGVSSEAVDLWQRVLESAPPIPTGIRRNGKEGLIPYADEYDNEGQKTQGHDRATLYTIWPFRSYMFPESGISKEDYELAVNTFELDDNGSEGWHYGDYCAAILGLADRAKQGVLFRVNEGRHGNTKVYFRFPPFQYSAEPDYVPNMESGGIVQSTLQYMLWNWKGDKIYLCPAWPKDWNCKFKFQAPGNTVVQGQVRNGEVTIDQVVPESRRHDIVICEPQ